MLGVEVDSRGRGGMQLDSEGIEIARGNSVERSIHSKVCAAPGQPSHCMAATASAGFGGITRVFADSSLTCTVLQALVWGWQYEQTPKTEPFPSQDLTVFVRHIKDPGVGRARGDTHV